MKFRLLGSVLAALLVSAQAFAATITVNSTDDTVIASDGKVTLREAITSINAGASADPDIVAQSPGTYGSGDTIAFNIAGAGVHVITLATNLPNINKPVFINGYSQPGASANSNPLNAGINAVLQIEIAGMPGIYGLNILAAGTTVRGLAIHGYRAIVVNTSNVVIAGNFIGTDAAGTTELPGLGGTYCVQVFSFITPADNVVIGGASNADRNLIVPGGASGTFGIGIQLPFVAPGPGTGYVIQGNYIGTDITGKIALSQGNGLDAISNATVVDNLISGNPGGAAQLIDNVSMQGNLIGTQRDGVTPLGNGNGIDIHGGKSVIGGSVGNVIANNGGFGIEIYNAFTAAGSNVNTQNSISRNSIYANGLLGISLDSSPFVLANDAGDADTWTVDKVGNDGQNYPVIASAALGGGNAVVSGTLNSIASRSFVLEFFASAACDASGYGEGQTYIGTANVVTDAGGNASFGPLSFAVPAGQSVITSTATDAAGNTSEFSKCLTATSAVAGPTSTAVVSSLNPSTFGQSVTFTATITGASPTGTVQFSDGAAPLGPPVTVSGAAAALTTSTLSVGTHPITAAYSGDAANAPSTSPALNQLVNAPALGATTTTLVSSLNPAVVGQSVTFSAYVTGAAAVTGSVTFSDGATTLGSVILGSGGTATLTTSSLAVGTHPITATYSGDASNAASSAGLSQLITPLAQPPAAAIPAPMLGGWAILSLIILFGAFAARPVNRRRRMR